MKKVIMVILDGFGLNDLENGNAIKDANMETFNNLFKEYPHSVLQASGEYVGLPDDQFGNSEVGHLTIGAGRKIKQDLLKANELLGSQSIEQNDKLIELVEHTINNDSTLHLCGLVSDGRVHSDIKYMKNILGHLKNMGVKKVKFHAITDGRDTKVDSSIGYLTELENVMKTLNMGKISTVCGRYYAMDRDNKWERTKVYTDLLLKGVGIKIRTFKTGIEACYKKNLTDEFLPPLILDEDATIKNNDAFLWLNFRGDRSRQILTVLKNEDFQEYKVKKIDNLKILAITDVPGAKLTNKEYLIENEEIYSLGVYLSDLGLRQARIAETEKFAHVTYFFNGGGKVKLKGCDNFLIPSKKVKTYDLTPNMSALEVTEQVLKCLEKDYDFILVNFANPDMLGHTGVIDATVNGLKTIDECLSRIVEAVDNNFYKLIITADHGNCDEMIRKDGSISTTHSIYPVPFILRDKHVSLKHKGDLTEIAPTILKYMDIAIPSEMKDTKTLFVEED
jgi:2,3-bisphosphoglycerate-independent phosphoglycerate mutase